MGYFRWILVCASLLVGVAALADSTPAAFAYRAEVPTTALSCSDNAVLISSLFQKSSQAAVTGASCVGQNKVTEGGHTYTRDVVRVDYTALREIVPVKAVFGGQEFMGQIFEHSGLFSSYSDCMAQMQIQNQNFQTETGLQVVASYCENSGSAKYPSYSLVIESFGKPTKRLYLASDLGARSGFGDPSPAILEAEAKVISDDGGHIVMGDGGHIFYYNTSPASISNMSLSYLNSPDQCTSQLAVAASIYKNAGVASVTALCDNNALRIISAYSMKVDEYFNSRAPLYSSFSDCMVDRARVLQNFTSQGGKPLGAICATSMSSGDQYTTRIFYKSNY